MPRPLRLLEFLGGPLDGACPPVPVGQDCILYTDGCAIYQYVLDEVFDGPRVRPVMRLAGQFPLPKKDGEE